MAIRHRTESAGAYHRKCVREIAGASWLQIWNVNRPGFAGGSKPLRPLVHGKTGEPVKRYVDNHVVILKDRGIAEMGGKSVAKAALTPKEKELQAVMREVRLCFNQLKTLAERLHHDQGVNPSMRAVMETLSTEDRQTVPDIANAKGVSRQHIQTIMSALQESGLVESFANPAHKRSPLFGLTAKGQATFEEVREREKEPLMRLAAGMSRKMLQQARKNLNQLNQHISEEIAKGDTNGTSA